MVEEGIASKRALCRKHLIEPSVIRDWLKNSHTIYAKKYGMKNRTCGRDVCFFNFQLVLNVFYSVKCVFFQKKSVAKFVDW